MSQQVFGWLKETAENLTDNAPCRFISDTHAKAVNAAAALPVVELIEDTANTVVKSDFVQSYVRAAEFIADTPLGQKVGDAFHVLSAAADDYVVEPAQQLDQQLGDLAAKEPETQPKAEPRTIVV